MEGRLTFVIAALSATSFSVLSGCAVPLMSDLTCSSCGTNKSNHYSTLKAAIWHRLLSRGVKEHAWQQRTGLHLGRLCVCLPPAHGCSHLQCQISSVTLPPACPSIMLSICNVPVGSLHPTHGHESHCKLVGQCIFCKEI